MSLNLETTLDCLDQEIVNALKEERIRIRHVRHHAKELRKTIRNSGFKVKISSEIEFANAGDFQNHLVYGFLGMGEDNITFTIASSLAANNNYPILPLFLPSRLKESLLIDTNNTRLATKLFFMYRDGNFKPIRTYDPVFLDGIYLPYTLAEKNILPQHLLINSPAIQKLTKNKLLTKQFLRGNGFRIPNYSQAFMPLETDLIPALITEFTSRYNIHEFAVKASEGSGGEKIRLYCLDDVEKAAKFAKVLMAGNWEVYLDERINPLLWKHKGKTFDWNIRAFTTLEDNPKWVGAIVRYAERSENPVNICTGAKVASLEEVCNKTGASVYAIMEDALRLTKAMYANAAAKGERNAGHLGLDIIVDEKGPCYIEVNDSQAGGFFEWALIEKKIPQQLPSILIPSLEKFLEKNHENNIDFEKADTENQLSFYFLQKNFKKISKGVNELFDFESFFCQLDLDKVPMDLSDADCHIAIGNHCAKELKLQEAINHYSIAKKLNPSMLEPSYNLGLIYLIMGRFNQAEKEFENSLFLAPSKKQLHLLSGIAQLYSGKVQKALKSFHSLDASYLQSIGILFSTLKVGESIILYKGLNFARKLYHSLEAGN